MRVPNGDWIKADRQGLTICDATSAAFAMDLPWDKLDVITYSWQKVLGGEGAHGMLILSPAPLRGSRATSRLGRCRRSSASLKGGKLIEGVFKGETINTPSMLCVEDAIDGLKWAEQVGGLKGLIARSEGNFAAIEKWVARAGWIDFLAEDKATRSNTSVCLKIIDPLVAAMKHEDKWAFAKRIGALLEGEKVAYDIDAHRDCAAGPAHLDRRHGREGRSRGAVPLARLGLRQRQGRDDREGVNPAVLEPCRNDIRDISMPKVLIADNLSPRAIDIFRQRGIAVRRAHRPQARRAQGDHRQL